MYYRAPDPFDDGRLSEVYSAGKEGSVEKYVWKELKYTNDFHDKERFQREIEITSKLNHESIVDIVFSDLLARSPYFVMPRAKENLNVAIKFDTTRKINKAEVFRQICEGVIYAHSQSTLHRDLKPSNILLTEDGSVKICDFGLAISSEVGIERITKTDEIGGTHCYAAPEQLEGSLRYADERSDVYSLGKILYFLYTKEHPELIDRTKVPENLYHIVKKATKFQMQERFSSVVDLLDEFLKTVPTSPRNTGKGLLKSPKNFSELQVEIQKLAKSARGRKFYTNVEIQRIVKELQLLMWRNRSMLLDDSVLGNPLAILNALEILHILGFNVSRHSGLQNYSIKGKEYQVAGQINQVNKTVAFSDQFSAPVTRFTEAHELGHAFLHEQDELHRDQPLNGSSLSLSYIPEENQANKFAAFFLMPKTQVLIKFRENFGVERLGINQETAEALFRSDTPTFIARVRDQRGLANFLSAATQVGNRRVRSLSESFGVSVGAMAIRLLELGCIELDS